MSKFWIKQLLSRYIAIFKVFVQCKFCLDRALIWPARCCTVPSHAHPVQSAQSVLAPSRVQFSQFTTYFAKTKHWSYCKFGQNSHALFHGRLPWSCVSMAPVHQKGNHTVTWAQIFIHYKEENENFKSLLNKKSQERPCEYTLVLGKTSSKMAPSHCVTPWVMRALGPALAAQPPLGTVPSIVPYWTHKHTAFGP